MNNFLEMVKGGTPEAVPFWFMRQAGRYLPEYKELRSNSNGFLDMVYSPEKVSEITLQPLRRFGMDAAIIFSDILVVPHALGRDVRFVEERGPQLSPLAGAHEISALDFSRFFEKLSPVYDALSMTRSMMDKEGFADKALIGFCGAPWTLACYMIEGKSSNDFLRTRRFAFASPDDFIALIDVLVEASSIYLKKQIESGAQAVQIFDSCAGILNAAAFERYVIEPTKRIVANVRADYPDVPILGFPRMAGTNYERYVRETGVDVVNLDHSVDVTFAAKTLQPLAVVQGNLDPALLLAGGIELERAAIYILETLKKNGKGFVFNLGHGVHKNTPIEHVDMLINIIMKHGRLI